MAGEKITLTREGYDKLKAELDYLMTKKRREIAKDLETARAFGDLRENAEYDAAKNAQAFNEKRIADLTQKLARAEILSEDRISKDQVFLGATVTLKDLNSDETVKYMIVSAEEADYDQNKISVTSPIGKALLGHKANETVLIQVPAGELKYKIQKIERKA